MGNRDENLEEEVGEVRREMAGLNEKLGALELRINAVRDLMMDIIVSLPPREERGKSHLVQSSNQSHLPQRENALGTGDGSEKMAHDCPTAHFQQRRLELPAFSGEDPCGWVLKAERYFMLYGIADGEKVAYAALSLEGEALNWLVGMEARNPIHGWEMFKHELMERFHTTRCFEQLTSLRQSTTVAHYKKRFELLSASIIRDVSEEMLSCIFINGLNDDVKAQVKLYRPCSLALAMSIAQDFENELKICELMDEDECVSAFEQLMSLRQSTTVACYREQFELLSAPIIRHISEDMLIHAFINGLNNDTKAQVNSVGPRNLAHVMSLAKEMEDRNKISVMMEEVKLTRTHVMSMNTNVTTKPHSFKFLGKIGSREVIVMIGTAATHNFISKEMVTALQIPVEIDLEAEGAAVCKNIVLKAQGIEIVQRFYPTKLGTADVVLGGEWLISLGSYGIHGNPMTITFEWHGRTVTLQAEPSLTKGADTEVMTLW